MDKQEITETGWPLNLPMLTEDEVQGCPQQCKFTEPHWHQKSDARWMGADWPDDVRDRLRRRREAV